MNRIALLAIAFSALVVVGGAAAYMSMRDASAREDVGDHEALKPLQDQLAGLAACEIQYRTHHRMSNDSVLISSCEQQHTTAGVHVPAGWNYPDLVFEARRDNARRRWRIYVDKQRVSLGTLVSALTELAPALLVQGNPSLKKAEDGKRAYDQGQQARDKAAKDQTENNRASWGN